MPSSSHDSLRSEVYSALAHNATTTPADVYAAAIALADATAVAPESKPSLPSPVAEPTAPPKAKAKRKRRSDRISGTCGLNTPTRDLARANRIIAEGLEPRLHSAVQMEQFLANRLHISVDDIPGTIRVLARLRIKTHAGSASRASELVPAGLSPAYARGCLNYLATRNYAHRSRITGSNAYAWSYKHPQQPRTTEQD